MQRSCKSEQFLLCRPDPDHIYRPHYRDPNVCSCHCLPHPPPTNKQLKIIGPAAYDEDAWSRLGPMGPLLDPKLYPAKVSAVPESTVSKCNQPNVFLKKVRHFSKIPRLCFFI